VISSTATDDVDAAELEYNRYHRHRQIQQHKNLPLDVASVRQQYVDCSTIVAGDRSFSGLSDQTTTATGNGSAGNIAHRSSAPFGRANGGVRTYHCRMCRKVNV
jgi:hypothetical protein